MIKAIVHSIKKYYICSSQKRFKKHLKLNGVIIGDSVNFRYPLHTFIDLSRPYLIKIGNMVDINDHFTILTHDYGTFVFRNLYNDFVSSSGAVSIGNNVVFGRNVTIMKGVTIGDNCIIGLGSVINKDIPSNSVAAGVPCKVICSIEEYYEKRKQSQMKEAIEYGRNILKETGKLPKITDFKEEWTLFLKEEDLLSNPEMFRTVKYRLKDKYHCFFEKHNPLFQGFDEFLEEIKK